MKYFVGRAGSAPRNWGLYLGPEHARPPVAVDYFRTEDAARHAMELLDRGLGVVDPHRPLGCRIQPIATSWRPAA